MASKITKGQVAIKIEGEDGESEEIILKPTLRAATQISNRYGGFIPAMQALGKLDLAACVFVVVTATGAKDAEAKALPEKLWSAGLNEVAAKCLEFTRFLMNGGEDDDEVTGGGGGKAVA